MPIEFLHGRPFSPEDLEMIRRQIEEGFDVIGAVDLRDTRHNYLRTRRLWNYHVAHSKLQTLDDRGLSLLDRCCLAEGQIEALLMKVALERRLSQKQLDDLGLFRQGYQQLRESVRDVKQLEWGRDDHPEYLALKRGCQSLIDTISNVKKQSPDSNQFEYITSNVHEVRWQELRRQP